MTCFHQEKPFADELERPGKNTRRGRNQKIDGPWLVAAELQTLSLRHLADQRKSTNVLLFTHILIQMFLFSWNDEPHQLTEINKTRSTISLVQCLSIISYRNWVQEHKWVSRPTSIWENEERKKKKYKLTSNTRQSLPSRYATTTASCVFIMTTQLASCREMSWDVTL